MKDVEIQNELKHFFKKSYWSARYWKEIRRIHNICNSKQKRMVQRTIAEAIAAKAVNPSHSRSYKQFLTRGEMKPYASFIKVLFQPHMEKELAQVLALALFSESSLSTGSRKAVELAMKVYPKAIGWNEPEALKQLKDAVNVIEATDYPNATQDQRETLSKAIDTLLNCQPKTSAEIITIKAYSQLSRLQVQTQGTDLNGKVSLAFQKACYLI